MNPTSPNQPAESRLATVATPNTVATVSPVATPHVVATHKPVAATAMAAPAGSNDRPTASASSRRHDVASASTMATDRDATATSGRRTIRTAADSDTGIHAATTGRGRAAAVNGGAVSIRTAAGGRAGSAGPSPRGRATEDAGTAGRGPRRGTGVREWAEALLDTVLELVLVPLGPLAVLVAVFWLVTTAPALALEVVLAQGRTGDGLGAVSRVLQNLVTALQKLLVYLATAAIAIAGVRYLAAWGDMGEVDAAKRTLKAAAVGYALAMLAGALAQILQSIVGR